MGIMDYSDAHKKLLEAQKQKPPIPNTLTIREMGTALKIDSTSHVLFVVRQLERRGLIEKFNQGKKKHIYYVKDAE